MATLSNGKCINMDEIAEGCKKRLTVDPEEPFEGDVPIAEIEKDVIALIQAD